MKRGIAYLLLVLAFTTPVMLSAGGNADKGTAKTNVQEKHLILAANPDFDTFDPAVAYEHFNAWIFGATYQTLYETEGRLDNLIPRLAEGYQISNGGLTYTFKLRRGVTFNSGNPLTAGDVKWSNERAINIKGNPSIHARNVASIEAPDDYTVVYHLKSVDPTFLVKIANNLFAVLDRKVVEAQGGTNAENADSTDKAKLWLDNHSAGSGPYQILSYTPKVEVVLERNPRYWEKASYYDKITLKVVADANAEAMMLQAGDIDLAFSIGPEQIRDLQNLPNVAIENASTVQVGFLLMNRDPEVGGPVANLKVQKAIRLALDYKGLQAIAGRGVVTPPTPFPLGLFGSLPAADISSYPRVQEAKALLAEAGYPSGFTTKLYVPTNFVSGVNLVTLAQKVQNDLRAIGINTELIPESIAISLDSYRNGKQPLGLWYWASDYNDNQSQLVFLPGNSVGLRANWQASANPQLAALGNTVAVETDEAKRKELFTQIQNALIEDTPFAVLIQFNFQYAIKKGLKGADYDLLRVDLPRIYE
jgi:peptide/nickel transport system substrate-binding protein